jgi:hypothetical protein
MELAGIVAMPLYGENLMEFRMPIAATDNITALAAGGAYAILFGTGAVTQFMRAKDAWTAVDPSH